MDISKTCSVGEAQSHKRWAAEGGEGGKPFFSRYYRIPKVLASCLPCRLHQPIQLQGWAGGRQMRGYEESDRRRPTVDSNLALFFRICRPTCN